MASYCPKEREAPPTTAWRVIFAFDKKVEKYNRDSYSPQLTDGKASAQEIDQVLSEIEDIRNPIHRGLRMSTFIMCGLTLCLFIAISYILYVDEKSNLIPALGVVMMINFLAGICRMFYLQNKYQDDCEEALKSFNRKFASRGLRWKLEKQWPMWLELHNDWRRDGGSKRQQNAQQPKTSNQNAGEGQLHLQIYQEEPANNKNIYNVYVPPSQH